MEGSVKSRSEPLSSREAGTSRNFISLSQQCSGWPRGTWGSRSGRICLSRKTWFPNSDCCGNGEQQRRWKTKAEWKDKLKFPSRTQRETYRGQWGWLVSRRCHACRGNSAKGGTGTCEDGQWGQRQALESQTWQKIDFRDSKWRVCTCVCPCVMAAAL